MNNGRKSSLRGEFMFKNGESVKLNHPNHNSDNNYIVIDDGLEVKVIKDVDTGETKIVADEYLTKA